MDSNNIKFYFLSRVISKHIRPGIRWEKRNLFPMHLVTESKKEFVGAVARSPRNGNGTERIHLRRSDDSTNRYLRRRHLQLPLLHHHYHHLLPRPLE